MEFLISSACIHKEKLGKILKYLHPNIVSNIEFYKEGSFYVFPCYHGCRFRNRNGTRKKIRYHKGEQCINPVNTESWRPVKKKYFGSAVRVYPTRYRKKNIYITEVFRPLFYQTLLIVLKMNIINYFAERQ